MNNCACDENGLLSNGEECPVHFFGQVEEVERGKSSIRITRYNSKKYVFRYGTSNYSWELIAYDPRAQLGIHEFAGHFEKEDGLAVENYLLKNGWTRLQAKRA